MSPALRPRRSAWAFVIFLELASPPAFAALSYADAQDEAVARSAALAARTRAIESARSSRIAAGRLPDPRLVFGVDNVPVDGPDRGSLTADFMTMRRVGVMQDFPNHSKREASAASADATIGRAEAEYRVEALKTRRAAALAWADRYYADARLALIDAVTDENRLLDIVVRAQIASGKANALDAIAVEQERAQIDDRRDELEHGLHAAERQLERYVGERGQDVLAGQPPLQVETGELTDRLDATPQLRLYEPLRAMAQAEVQAADAARRPDWGVELSYAQRGAQYSNMVSLQVSVDLPLFLSTRQGPRLAARRSDLAAVESAREDERREIRSTVEQDLAEYAELRSRVRRVREVVLPLAKRRVDTALDEYRATRVELPQVVAARREAVESQLKLLELEQKLAHVVTRLSTVLDKEAP